MRDRRRDADRRIAAGAGPFRPDLAWREAELTSQRERLTLARSVRSVLAELSSDQMLGASPLYRPAVRPHAAELTALADRLADLDRPVEAVGILAVQQLLTDAGSFLYARPYANEEPRDISAEISAVLDRLEVRP